MNTWGGGLKTMSECPFLSFFLQLLMHVLTSSSVDVKINVQVVKANADWHIFHAQQHPSATILMMSTATLKATETAACQRHEQ